MTDPELYLTLSLSGLAGLAMVTTAGLSGWRSWLTLKHSQLDAQADALPPSIPRDRGSRSRT